MIPQANWILEKNNVNFELRLEEIVYLDESHYRNNIDIYSNQGKQKNS